MDSDLDGLGIGDTNAPGALSFETGDAPRIGESFVLNPQLKSSSFTVQLAPPSLRLQQGWRAARRWRHHCHRRVALLPTQLALEKNIDARCDDGTTSIEQLTTVATSMAGSIDGRLLTATDVDELDLSQASLKHSLAQLKRLASSTDAAPTSGAVPSTLRMSADIRRSDHQCSTLLRGRL
eukprot:COSAG02_NODE_9710_length_2135_cov_3.255403_2_plen_180_part_00